MAIHLQALGFVRSAGGFTWPRDAASVPARPKPAMSPVTGVAAGVGAAALEGIWSGDDHDDQGDGGDGGDGGPPGLGFDDGDDEADDDDDDDAQP